MSYCPLGLDSWGGQRTQLLIATGQLLSLEQSRDAGVTGQGLVFPARIDLQLGQQGPRLPTGMRAAQTQDTLPHFRWKRAQWASDGPTHLRGEASTPLLLPTPPPFSYRPD